MKRGTILSIVFAAAVINAAAQQTPSTPNSAADQRTSDFITDQLTSDFVAQVYTDVLPQLHEPSLLEESRRADARVYRLLWWGGLAVQSPISIRLNVNNDGTGLVTVKTVTRRADGRAGHLSERTRKLSKEKTERFLARVQEVGYWNLPTRDPRFDENILDGSEWIIEGVENRNYKLVPRKSPEKGPVRQLGTSLIHLAGLDWIKH